MISKGANVNNSDKNAQAILSKLLTPNLDLSSLVEKFNNTNIKEEIILDSKNNLHQNLVHRKKPDSNYEKSPKFVEMERQRKTIEESEKNDYMIF